MRTNLQLTALLFFLFTSPIEAARCALFSRLVNGIQTQLASKDFQSALKLFREPSLRNPFGDWVHPDYAYNQRGAPGGYEAFNADKQMSFLWYLRQNHSQKECQLALPTLLKNVGPYNLRATQKVLAHDLLAIDPGGEVFLSEVENSLGKGPITSGNIVAAEILSQCAIAAKESTLSPKLKANLSSAKKKLLTRFGKEPLVDDFAEAWDGF